MKIEKSDLQLIVDTLGEQKIESLSRVIGNKPFSFSTLYNYIRKFKIIQSLRTQKSVDEIAHQNKVSRMTVYRVLWDNSIN